MIQQQDPHKTLGNTTRFQDPLTSRLWPKKPLCSCGDLRHHNNIKQAKAMHVLYSSTMESTQQMLVQSLSCVPMTTINFRTFLLFLKDTPLQPATPVSFWFPVSLSKQFNCSDLWQLQTQEHSHRFDTMISVPDVSPETDWLDLRVTYRHWAFFHISVAHLFVCLLWKIQVLWLSFRLWYSFSYDWALCIPCIVWLSFIPSSGDWCTWISPHLMALLLHCCRLSLLCGNLQADATLAYLGAHCLWDAKF